MLTTVLLHQSGQWIEGTAGAPMAKQDAQSVGSALTYLRRYALAAFVGIVQEDDDGEGATGRNKTGKAGRGQASGGSAKDATSAPPPDFSKTPAALQQPEEKLPFEIADENGEEYGPIVDDAMTQAIFKKALRGGVTKELWTIWYQEVCKREWNGAIHEEDVKRLLEAAQQEIAQKMREAK